METLEQLIEKVKILGFTTYESLSNDIPQPNGRRFTVILLESLNIKYHLINGGSYILFMCPNSGALSEKYTIEEAYSRIEKEFEDRFTFKAFNKSLFRELDTSIEVEELLNKNNVIVDLMEKIKNCTKSEHKPIMFETEYIMKPLYDLHNISFYLNLNNARDIAIFENYKLFIKNIFGLRLSSNRVPKRLRRPMLIGSTLNYLKVVAAYQLLIDKSLIEE